MNQPNPFFAPKDRDAWATIRGFVYQAEVTVERWLDLAAGEVLELECGEDVDRVSRSLVDDGTLAERVVEQVKYLAANLTLRSPSARAAVAHCYGHRAANPDVRLQFLFTTTAGVGREQSSALPDGVTGIGAWSALRAGTVDAEATSLYAGEIRRFLTHAGPPDGLSTDEWGAFQGWLLNASDDEFMEVVEALEWVSNASDFAMRRDAIVSILCERSFAADASSAQLMFERLLVAVLTRLSQPGLKQLTRSDLQAVLNVSATPEQERQLGRVRAVIELLDRRVALLEDRQRALELEHEAFAARLDTADEALVGLRGHLNAASYEAGAASRVAIGVLASMPLLDPPPLTLRGSTRAAVIRQILSGRKLPGLTALYGTISSGKSQLARRLADELGSGQRWIQFPRVPVYTPPATMAAYLIQMVKQSEVPHSGPEAGQSGGDWRTQCARLTRDLDAIVLDDVPVHHPSDAFGRRLVELVTVALDRGVSVIVTSAEALDGLDDLTAAGRDVLSIPVPALSADEIREVLEAYGAPATRWVGTDLNILWARTRGAPAYVQAVASYLSGRGWRDESQDIQRVLQGDYAEPVNKGTVRSLMTEIPEDETRDLLYRLTTTTGGYFTATHVRLLADIPREITRSGERFTVLVGPWVQVVGDTWYRVNPLVQDLGRENLPTECFQNCHAALAGELLAADSLSELNVAGAITHLIAADAVNDAGLVLAQGLISALVDGPETGPVLLGAIWRGVPLPGGMAPFIALVIRGLQAALAAKTGDDYEFAVREVDRILAEYPDLPKITVVMASMTIATQFATRDASVAARFVLKVLDAWDAAQAEVQEKMGSPIEVRMSPDTLVWLALADVNNAEDLWAWVRMVLELPPHIRARVLAAPDAAEWIEEAASRPFRRELVKAAAEQDWVALLAALADMEVATQNAVPDLASALCGARISAGVEAGLTLDELLGLADTGITRVADGDGAFLIARAAGVAAMDRADDGRARAWLERADRAGGHAYLRARAMVKLYLARIIGQSSDPLVSPALEAVLRLTSEAVALTDRMPVNPLDMLDGTDAAAAQSDRLSDSVTWSARGELAIARWRAGDLSGARTAWLATVDALLTRAPDTDLHRWYLAVAQVVGGHFVNVLLSLPPSDSAPPPAQGDFVRPSRAGVDATGTRPRLAMGAFGLAEDADQSTVARTWATRLLALIAEDSIWVPAPLPLHFLARDAIEQGNYGDAVLFARRAERAVQALRHVDAAAVDAPYTTAVADPDAVLGDDPGTPDALAAERRAFARVMLMGGLHVGLLAWKDRAAGSVAAGALAAVARAGAMTSPIAHEWSRAADVVEAGFIGQSDLQLLMTLARDPSTSVEVRALACFAVTAQRGAPVEIRYRWSVAVAPLLEEHLRQFPRVMASLVVPFYWTVWSETFEINRRWFTEPQVVARRLALARSGGGANGIRDILLAIDSGLDVTLRPETRAWLSKT